MSGLPCMNCHQPTTEADGKVFAEVFVCTTCHTMATRLYQRLEIELKKLLAISKESIRLSLVQGKLHYGTAEEEEPSKQELLKMIVQFSEKKDAERSARR